MCDDKASEKKALDLPLWNPAKTDDLNGITSVQEAYKLGFIHGAIAMLQYIKARLLGTTPANQKIIERIESNLNKKLPENE